MTRFADDLVEPVEVIHEGDFDDEEPKAALANAFATKIANLTAGEIDLAKVQRDWERQLEDLLAAWTDISARQIDQIIDQVRAAITSNDLAALARLNVTSAEAAEILTRSMTEMALTAAQRMSEEAARQDVPIDPVASDTEPLAATATALASLLAAGLASSAGREALRRWSTTTSGDDVAAAVRRHLEGLSDATVRSSLGGALTSAQNTGRLNTALAGPTAALYASEQMDGNTCRPCKAVNGKWIGNTDDPDIAAKVEAVYPNGGYVSCEGGVRCRGTIVSVYRPDSVDSTEA